MKRSTYLIYLMLFLLAGCELVNEQLPTSSAISKDAHNTMPGVEVHLKISTVSGSPIPQAAGLDVKLVFEGFKFRPNTSAMQIRDEAAQDALLPRRLSSGLSLPLVITNVETVATSLGKLNGFDALGSLQFEPTVVNGTKYWYPERDTQGTVRIQYHAAIPEKVGNLGVGPPIELRKEGLSISGGSGVFILEPELASYQTTFTDGARDKAHAQQQIGLYYTVHWDLSNAVNEASAFGLSVQGLQKTDKKNNAKTLSKPSPLYLSSAAQAVLYENPRQFSQGYVLAGLAKGDVGFYQAQSKQFKADKYMAGWQGQPSFNVKELMRWGEELYAVYNVFFNIDEKNINPYMVFMRSNDINPGGGMARGNAFIVTYDENTTMNGLIGTFSHEMFHTFLGGLSDPGGLESSWFSEGLAVYYQNLIPMRAGMREPVDFLNSINSTAVRYYTNLKIDTPNVLIPHLFWADTRVRVLPYDRGSIYFAMLNYQILEHSGGEQNLDDVLAYLREREQKGETLTQSIWREALLKFAGEVAVANFEAMLDGAIIELPSNAYGPCFERYSDKFRRYELGFPPQVLTEQPRQIRDIIPGSNAEKAGLREGDIITRPVPQDSVQGNQEATLTFGILRRMDDGTEQEFDITYLPRGEQVDAWQWRKVRDFETCFATWMGW